MKQYFNYLKKIEDYDSNLAHNAKMVLVEAAAPAVAHGAGFLVICPDTESVLLARRSDHVSEPGTWGIFGGGIERGESPLIAAMREIGEEGGLSSSDFRTYKDPIYIHDGDDVVFNTFPAICDKMLQPELNNEHSMCGWFTLDNLPTPLHFGVEAMMSNPEACQIISDIISGEVSF
jgi:8-oxo-dGTP pyrophosphatase MutT (NUDIX family)